MAEPPSSALRLLRVLRRVFMKARHFHHQSRSGEAATGPIAFADEDDDQIETWMIGQGQELSGNRRAVARKPWSRF
jgi:hypothetical protein